MSPSTDVDGRPTARPYADALEHLEDELGRLDVLLRMHLESLWGDDGATPDGMRKMFVSDEEVASLLAVLIRDDQRDSVTAGPGEPDGGLEGHRGQPVTSERGRLDRGRDPHPGLVQALDERTDAINARQATTARAGSELRLRTLVDRFDLEARHVDALLVALAPEFDRKYERIYGYLEDDVTQTRPTIGLALAVLEYTETDRLAAREVFSRHSPLRRHRLVRLAGDERAPYAARTVAVEERVVAFLLGTDVVATELSNTADVRTPSASIDDLLVDESAAARLAELERAQAVTATEDGSPPHQLSDADESECGRRLLIASLHGPPGVGKSTAAGALAAAAGRSILRIDASMLAKPDYWETVRLLEREAMLQAAALQVEDVNSLCDRDDVDLGALVRTLDGFSGDVFLLGVGPLSLDPSLRLARHEFESIHLPMPSYELRRSRWREVTELSSDVDPDALAATFRLTSGQIDDAVAAAKTLSDGSALDAAAIHEGCRRQTTKELGSLARKIETGYGWDDIVLPPETMRQLRDVAAHVTRRGRVYVDWGFAEKFSRGNGLNVLFSGPSGTGKTMAAEIIAAETGLDLYKVDLANVVSKYIGETEKNLGRIFDEATDSNAILLFDEADALFGERSEVSDAHDRYANIEVNYLLQRVEEHEGLVVLTTNFDQNIDDAFRRRIHVCIDFPLPDKRSRAAIWRNVFPNATPLGDLDYEFLSTLEIAGGSIRNVALTAAFLAANGDDRVEMEHIVTAAKREFEKTGKLSPPERFGEYSRCVGESR
ncbi:AAA family ATPase [Halalkalicoccus ordinarius]|uniref:AAA family ATPase n=1 Tax=Halalkalicoccus ordinarius TaxID=3116651 RepID=UPI00300F2E20